MVKKGDTLIEVLLAVGIFSMIAIAVVAVLSGGTNSAQTALESTVAREEIDAQAEALRYIHTAYIADKDSNSNDDHTDTNKLPAVQLWQTITNNALVLKNNSSDDSILKYAPSKCQDLYDSSKSNNIFAQKAFVLNVRKLNEGKDAYISVNKSPSVFQPPTTYPRLIFGTSTADNLIASDSNNLFRAEGIYVIAVADASGTQLIDLDGSVPKTSVGFYDFYIRSCWYGNDTEEPSTISTVIRLYNPDVLTHTSPFISSINGDTPKQVRFQRFTEQDEQDVKDNLDWWPRKHTKGWTFDGWCDKKDVVTEANGESWCRGSLHNAPSTFYSDTNTTYDFVPVFSHTKYTMYYNSNGSSWKTDPQICYEDENEGKCIVKADNLTRSGYRFMGWCDGAVSMDNSGKGICQGRTYQKGEIIYAPSGFPSSRIINLTAIWNEQDEEITIYTTWTSNTDYDSYLELSNPNGGYTRAYWGTTDPIMVTYHNKTYALATGDGDGRGGINNRYYEKFVIHTLGGKDYYYAIKNWSNSGYIGAGITVTVSGPYLGTKTFTSTVKNNCEYWNVFAYQDGSIVERNTCSSGYMEYPY